MTVQWPDDHIPVCPACGNESLGEENPPSGLCDDCLAEERVKREAKLHSTNCTNPLNEASRCNCNANEPSLNNNMDEGDRFVFNGNLYEIVGHYAMSFKTQRINPKTDLPWYRSFSLLFCKKCLKPSAW